MVLTWHSTIFMSFLIIAYDFSVFFNDFRDSRTEFLDFHYFHHSHVELYDFHDFHNSNMES